MSAYDYDLLVIGSGPAGHKAAIQAAKLGKKVGVIERKTAVGGVCINTGTIPSKTLREAALRLSGYRDRDLYGASYTVKQHITMADLLFRVEQVIQNEIDVSRHQLMRNDVDILAAHASFVDAHTLRMDYVDSPGKQELRAENVVIAVGTTTTRDPNIPFDGEHIFLSDDVLHLKQLPRTLAVIGGGVIGLEYACIFAALGVRITLIDKYPNLLPFVDREIMDALVYHLRSSRATLRLGETVKGMELADDELGKRVRIHLDSGKEISSEQALYSIGRTGATRELNLPGAGLEADARGRLKVNEHYQTAVPHIYAVGDVIGFPALASTSMEQGRMAACHAFGVPSHSLPELFPFGIYTVPGISMVGKTEEQLTELGVPYEVGRASYKEIARGQILGDHTGLLKLIFHYETRKVLGVHIIGREAAELVHIGQAVMAFGGTVDYFIDAVFNFPTLAECYKTAAFDGINRLAR
ncbi:MAG: Si-specific NAD(P)(+) transhydrogenase [Planctomycetes bacterium]|nr:Si-specific NAD(P)(+) transhydrogenase [Planctomycetota bacterium]